jgi:hypothetical protein
MRLRWQDGTVRTCLMGSKWIRSIPYPCYHFPHNDFSTSLKNLGDSVALRLVFIFAMANIFRQINLTETHLKLCILFALFHSKNNKYSLIISDKKFCLL